MRVYTYERKDSPFVWLKWLHPVTGQSLARSSGVRKDDPIRERKLAKQINKMEGGLLETAPEHAGEQFEVWVVPTLRQRHADHAGSLDKNLNAWNWLSAYFREIKVTIPRELTRQHLYAYVPWRTAKRKKKVKAPGRNTAIYDLRVLGKIMQEAVERGFVTVNVARRLGLKRDAVKVKPEMRDADIAKLRAALVGKPDWMRVSFEVAIHTGLRFHETRIDVFANVDFDSQAIFLPAPKGGQGRAFSIDLPPVLVPMLQAMRDRGQQWTWTHERAPGEPPRSLQWREVFDAARLPPPFSFHCTRVTFITRKCRAGVPETVTMKMVNHASREISRIYQRLTVDDVRKYREWGTVPPADDATPGSPPA